MDLIDLIRENENIEIKIQIVQRCLEIYKDHLKKTIDKETKDRLIKSLKREENILKKYKIQYTEFFI